MRHLVGSEARSIVATHLVDAGSKRCRAVVLTNDDIGICGKAAFEVRANWCDEDEEEVFAGRMNANLGARADQQRTDIECCSALVRWDESFVEAHHLVTSERTDADPPVQRRGLGPVVDAGTGVCRDGIIYYAFTGERLIPHDYVITATSRVTNVWAFIVTLLIILLAIGSFFYRRKSKVQKM